MSKLKKTVDSVDRSAVHKQHMDMISEIVGKAVAEAWDAHMKSDNPKDWMAWTGQGMKHLKSKSPNAFVAAKTKGAADSLNALGRYYQYMHQAGNKSFLALQIMRAAGDKEMADAYEKALGFSTISGGGAVVPIEVVQPMIDLLVDQSTVLSYPVATADLDGFMQLPYMDTGATANWVGEGSANNASQPTLGQLNLRPFTMMIQVPVNRLWLEKAGDASLIMRQLQNIGAEKLDNTLLNSVGSASQPLGLKGLIKAANQNAMTGSPDASTTQEDLLTARQAVKDGKIPFREAQGGWVFSNRTERWLLQQTATTAVPIFKEEMMTRGTLYGVPFRTTSQLADNLGGGSNESTVYLIWAPGFLFANASDFRGEVIDNAAYNNSSGTVVAGASQNEALISLVFSCDFTDLYRGSSGAAITGVTWGA